MPHVSVTRLRIRSPRFLPLFAIGTVRTARQAARARGFAGGAVLADPARTFRTITVWRERDDMRAYVAGGAHGRVMPRLLGWCDEASVVGWEQPDATVPGRATAEARMRAEGRPSRVRHPSDDHAGMMFRPARRTVSARIRPSPARS